jgi:hypothetical protein
MDASLFKNHMSEKPGPINTYEAKMKKKMKVISTQLHSPTYDQSKKHCHIHLIFAPALYLHPGNG